MMRAVSCMRCRPTLRPPQRPLLAGSSNALLCSSLLTAAGFVRTAVGPSEAAVNGMKRVLDGDPTGILPFHQFLSGAMASSRAQPTAAGEVDMTEALDALARAFPNLSFPLERHQVATNEARACLPCIKARNPDLARRIHRREGLVADDQAHKFERYHHPLVACLGANLDGPSGMLDQAVSVVLLMRHGTLSNRQLTPVPGHLEQGRCCFRDAGAMKRALAHGAFSVIVCLARAPQIKGDRFKTSPRPGPTLVHIVPTEVGPGQPVGTRATSNNAGNRGSTGHGCSFHLVAVVEYRPRRLDYSCLVRSGDRWYRSGDSVVEEFEPVSSSSMDVMRLYSRNQLPHLVHALAPRRPAPAPCPASIRSPLSLPGRENSLAPNDKEVGSTEPTISASSLGMDIWERGLSATLAGVLGKKITPVSTIDELAIGPLLHHFVVDVDTREPEQSLGEILRSLKQSLWTIGVVAGEITAGGIGVVIAVLACRLGGASGWSAMHFDRHGASPAMQASSQVEHAGKAIYVRLEVRPARPSTSSRSQEPLSLPPPLPPSSPDCTATLEREIYALQETNGIDPSRARSALLSAPFPLDLDRLPLRICCLAAPRQLDSSTRELLEQAHSKIVNAQEAYCRRMARNGAPAPVWLYGIRGLLPDQPTVVYLENIGSAMLLHCRIAQHRAHHVVLPADVTSRTPHSATSIAERLGEALQGLGFVAMFDRVDEPLLIESVPPLLHHLNGRPREEARVCIRLSRCDHRKRPTQSHRFLGEVVGRGRQDGGLQRGDLEAVAQNDRSIDGIWGPAFKRMNVDVVMEFASSFRHPLATRKAYHRVLEIIGSRPATILMAYLDRLSRRAPEVEIALDKFEEMDARFAVPTCSLQRFGAASSSSTCSTDSPTAGTWTFLDKQNFAEYGRSQLEHSLALSLEHSFYSSSTIVVDAALATANVALGAGRHHQVVDLRKAIADYARRHGLDKVVTFARTSTDHLSEGSLLRQKPSWG
ncbi:BQ2448_4753 [Microbotryum intermedium]|uniref:BQ2448_4753 protein n=1 Tax=Microbotryum intermedium TaxID=269621 RepID=A0A238FGY8_9BASI|nr:BQ2448_4753 [Microbotryum intermedium]